MRSLFMAHRLPVLANALYGTGLQICDESEAGAFFRGRVLVHIGVAHACAPLRGLTHHGKKI